MDELEGRILVKIQEMIAGAKSEEAKVAHVIDREVVKHYFAELRGVSPDRRFEVDPAGVCRRVPGQQLAIA